jgi:hypothetical protein
MVILPNTHTSPDTAYVVADYPYGFRARCSIRYWLEHKPNHGFRLMSQTTNPKSANHWNKPKASTYAQFGACMYLDDNGHVHWTSLTEYCGGAEAFEWSNKYREGVPEVGLDLLDRFVCSKRTYDAHRKPGDPLSVGLAEAKRAFATKTYIQPANAEE